MGLSEDSQNILVEKYWNKFQEKPRRECQEWIFGAISEGFMADFWRNLGTNSFRHSRRIFWRNPATNSCEIPEAPGEMPPVRKVCWLLTHFPAHANPTFWAQSTIHEKLPKHLWTILNFLRYSSKYFVRYSSRNSFRDSFRNYFRNCFKSSFPNSFRDSYRTPSEIPPRSSSRILPGTSSGIHKETPAGTLSGSASWIPTYSWIDLETPSGFLRKLLPAFIRERFPGLLRESFLDISRNFLRDSSGNPSEILSIFFQKQFQNFFFRKCI